MRLEAEDEDEDEERKAEKIAKDSLQGGNLEYSRLNGIL